MSDLQLTIAAATLEVGIAVLALLAVVVGKPGRRRTVVVFGALTPAIVAMVWMGCAQFINPPPGSMAGAGWLMGLAAYLLVLVGGLFTSFLPRPASLAGRYLLGLGSTPVSLGLLLLL